MNIRSQSRFWMSCMLLLADAAGLFLAGLAAVGLRAALGNLVNPPFYWNLLALIPIFLVAFALRGLYPAVGLNPVDELRRLASTTSAAILVFAAITFWLRTGEYFSRLIIAFGWVFALVALPLCRWLLRLLAGRMGRWGEPVVVIGAGPQTRQITRFLLERGHFGLKPVLAVNEAGELADFPIPSLSIDEWMRQFAPGSPALLKSIRTAILVDAELPEGIRPLLSSSPAFSFQHLILISDLGWIGSLGVTPFDLEGLLGLEVRQNLLGAWDQRFKRLLDLGLALLFSLVALPLGLLIGLWIRLDSPGPALYGHPRLGKGGRNFTMLKFRTMTANAEQVLQAHLAAHPEAQAEWQASQKLKLDPRITRVGRLLRRASLDELPQLWNVFKGEMSLVGPRPIVNEEIIHYQAGYHLYQRVLPGLTGLWQVSGRNNTSYAERVRYDEYYVRNWSIWLDLYILLRTVWVVLRGEGAY